MRTLDLISLFKLFLSVGVLNNFLLSFNESPSAGHEQVQVPERSTELAPESSTNGSLFSEEGGVLTIDPGASARALDLDPGSGRAQKPSGSISSISPEPNPLDPVEEGLAQAATNTTPVVPGASVELSTPSADGSVSLSVSPDPVLEQPALATPPPPTEQPLNLGALVGSLSAVGAASASTVGGIAWHRLTRPSTPSTSYYLSDHRPGASDSAPTTRRFFQPEGEVDEDRRYRQSPRTKERRSSSYGGDNSGGYQQAPEQRRPALRRSGSWEGSSSSTSRSPKPSRRGSFRY